jgi:thymidylate kinase
MMDHSKQRQAMLVSFSGIDGAGKSTQIESLRRRLVDGGLRVQLVTFWDDVARLKGIREGVGHKVFKGDKGVGTPETPIQRRDKNIRTPLMTVVRMGLYLIDAISLRSAVNKAKNAEADVVIFDRYIYDEAANLNLDKFAERLYLRALMTLVPRPEVSFVLDADPEQARARKPEYPLDFLHSNRSSYLKLSEFLGDVTVVRPMPLEQAKAEVIQHVISTKARLSPNGGDASGPRDSDLQPIKTRSNG